MDILPICLQDLVHQYVKHMMYGDVLEEYKCCVYSGPQENYHLEYFMVVSVCWYKPHKYPDHKWLPMHNYFKELCDINHIHPYLYAINNPELTECFLNDNAVIKVKNYVGGFLSNDDYWTMMNDFPLPTKQVISKPWQF